jgi:hypothetical protein
MQKRTGAHISALMTESVHQYFLPVIFRINRFPILIFNSIESLAGKTNSV